jgi:uncharacterized protein YuzE
MVVLACGRIFSEDEVMLSALITSFPSLAAELSQQLRVAGRAPLADQIDAATIARVTFDGAADAGYLYVKPSRELNIVEANVVGVRHGDAIEVETHYWTIIDTDHFDRLIGIEILAPGDIKNALRKHTDG